MLYILTSVWVLRRQNAGRNSHFQRCFAKKLKNAYFRLLAEKCACSSRVARQVSNQLLIFTEKLSPLPGFEPGTSLVPSRYATNSAILALMERMGWIQIVVKKCHVSFPGVLTFSVLCVVQFWVLPS